MLLGDIRISADAIHRAMAKGGWCNDYTCSVEWYLRHKVYVTLREAIEVFPEGDWENEPDERECPHCGSYYTPSADSETNPPVGVPEIVRLFTDIGDQHMIDFFTAISDLGWDIPLDMKIDLSSVENEDWYYREPKPAPSPFQAVLAPAPV